MNDGWVKLYRKMVNNPMFFDGIWVQLTVYLLMKSSHSPKDVMFEGKITTLEPGTIMTNRRELSEALKCSQSKIEYLLTLMESEQQIQQQKKHHNRLISIVNWKKYQGSQPQIEQQTDSKPTANHSPIVVNKRLRSKEVKNNNTILYESVFFDLWNKYPKHRKYNFKKAKEAFGASVKSDLDVERINKALDNYLASRIGEDDRYTQGAYTWFSDWKSWVDYQPKSIKKDKYGNTIA